MYVCSKRFFLHEHFQYVSLLFLVSERIWYTVTMVWFEWRKYCQNNFLNRTLILVPVFAEEGHNERGEIIKSPAIDLGFEPFYILYYSEIRFEVGHFQSIRPNSHSQPTQMKEIPETIEEISPPIYQSSIQ